MEDYPKNLAELEKRFFNDEACLEYLSDLRWPDGFRCPRCNGHKAWKMKCGLFRCSSCNYMCSVISGTIFERTRKPLVMWFRAIWWVCSQKNGTSAKSIQRILELGSYQTAWVWLHKIRRAMISPDRDRLSGIVEVDESFIGGKKSGKRGRGAAGKVLVGIAVEDKGKKGIGRIRIDIIADAASESLMPFVQKCIEPKSTVRTDDWNGYNGIVDAGYKHTVVGNKEVKMVHLVASLLKRWLLGTHQGGISHEHLAYYLDEFTFRFNRRRSKHRGKLFYRLLQNAVQTQPTTYNKMVLNIRGVKPANHNI